jgi:hypothetical protein
LDPLDSQSPSQSFYDLFAYRPNPFETKAPIFDTEKKSYFLDQILFSLEKQMRGKKNHHNEQLSNNCEELRDDLDSLDSFVAPAPDMACEGMLSVVCPIF